MKNQNIEKNEGTVAKQTNGHRRRRLGVACVFGIVAMAAGAATVAYAHGGFVRGGHYPGPGFGHLARAIIAMRGARTALGIHTWMAVYLTPFHNQVLQEYASDGFTVDTFKRDKDRLVETLSKISGLRLPEIEP